ncbi:MAG TPA: DUF559 domain-containing protein [Ktedonobacterales bacterium]|nr:DUF559 domain-containing protein [Ktedonobacterales bacterium]
MNATPRRVRAVQVNPAVPAPKVNSTATRKPRTPKTAPAAAAPIKEKSTKAAKPLTLAQLTAKAKREQYEQELLFQIKVARLPVPVTQHLWHPTINYRADLCFEREHLIVEVDGGVYLRHGHHNSGKGYEYDRRRDAEALTLGYLVLRVTPGMVKDGSAIEYVERVLHAIWARNKRTA